MKKKNNQNNQQNQNENNKFNFKNNISPRYYSEKGCCSK